MVRAVGLWLSEPGAATVTVSRGEAIARAAETPVILLNAPMIGQRLGYPELSGLDLLELFAFVHPARFVVPTGAGLARIVDALLGGQSFRLPGNELAVTWADLREGGLAEPAARALFAALSCLPIV